MSDDLARSILGEILESEDREQNQTKPERNIPRILTAVPEQRHTFDEKLDWLEDAAKGRLGAADIVIAPQEYFGGVQKCLFDTKEPAAYSCAEVLEPVTRIARETGVGILFGALVDTESEGRRERVFGISRSGVCVGSVDKCWLPAYDHVKVRGSLGVTPEEHLGDRELTLNVGGVRFGVLFCWEVFSAEIWSRLRLSGCNTVAHMIKFGVRGWPSKVKDPREGLGGSLVKGFGYGDDGGWLERLQMGSRWDVCCPIVVSCNSWLQPWRAWPLCGVIEPFEGLAKLKIPEKGRRGTAEQVVSVEEVDVEKWELVRGGGWQMFQTIGEWPSSEARKRTMSWKIRRMEAKLLK